MYGITDHYLQTLHDFNTFGDGLEAFLPEQALRAKFIQDFMLTSLEFVHDRRESLRLTHVLQASESDSIHSAIITAFSLCCSHYSVCIIPTGYSR